jgi:hypothetical protein
MKLAFGGKEDRERRIFHRHPCPSHEALAVQLFLLPDVLFFTPFFVQAASSGPFLRLIFLRRPFLLASLF